jgi:hypothetical protein
MRIWISEARSRFLLTVSTASEKSNPGGSASVPVDIRTLESKHEIASVWSYRHRCHDRDTGNGTDDDPHLRYHERAGSRHRGEYADIIS